MTEERIKMKADTLTRAAEKTLGIRFDNGGINRNVKAVIVNFGDERGDIVVENSNFGTRRKYPDFDEGKKKAGLCPLQIVFSGIAAARLCGDRYIGRDGAVHSFAEI